MAKRKKVAGRKSVKAAGKKAAKKPVKKAVKAARKVARKAAARKAAPKKAAKKAARKAAARKAAPRKAAPKKAAARKAAPKKAAPKKAAAKKAAAKKSPARKSGPARAGNTAPIRGAIPSSLGMNGGSSSSSARTGREELLQHIKEHNETSPAITAGDVDADWQLAYSSGDEAPGGDNPTPDQDVVDEIGEALGVNYEDGEELKGAAKIEDRDKHRWELDPASKDDFDDQ